LKDQQGHPIVVEGHTDSQGSDASNQELSRGRAQAVRDFLVSRGVPADRIRADALGSSRPVGDNKTPEGRASNRRVEIVVQPTESK
jgi:outer membrane protein OmpA-like peptidoglycan-associated protein